MLKGALHFCALGPNIFFSKSKFPCFIVKVHVLTSPGVILQKVQRPVEPPPTKVTRVDLPSDDEVEVVTEWLAPSVLEGSNLLENPDPPTSPPLHVPVIQRPTDVNANPNKDKVKKVLASPNKADGKGNEKNLKMVVNSEDIYLLDARKEGNVSRFLNVSGKDLQYKQMQTMVSCS